MFPHNRGTLTEKMVRCNSFSIRSISRKIFIMVLFSHWLPSSKCDGICWRKMNYMCCARHSRIKKNSKHQLITLDSESTEGNRYSYRTTTSPELVPSFTPDSVDSDRSASYPHRKMMYAVAFTLALTSEFSLIFANFVNTTLLSSEESIQQRNGLRFV